MVIKGLRSHPLPCQPWTVAKLFLALKSHIWKGRRLRAKGHKQTAKALVESLPIGKAEPQQPPRREKQISLQRIWRTGENQAPPCPIGSLAQGMTSFLLPPGSFCSGEVCSFHRWYPIGTKELPPHEDCIRHLSQVKCHQTYFKLPGQSTN